MGLIRALVTGVLHEAPVVRVSKNGKPFTTAKLRADAADGAVWCSLIAFGAQAEALAEQRANAALSVAGRVTPNAWLDKAGEPKAGLSLVVDQVAALRTRPKPKPTPAPAPAASPGFDDDLPDLYH